MSNELWREIPTLWSERDHASACAHGWSFEPIFGVMAFNQGNTAHKRMFAKGWALMWLGSDAPGFNADKPCADYIAKQAALGIPLYERAWLVHCKLYLEGKIADGDFVNEDTEGPYG